jgi:hypothetical protein
VSVWRKRRVKNRTPETEAATDRGTEERETVDLLILNELEREKADNSARQANVITRISIVIATNAIVLLPVFSGGLNLSEMTGLQWLLPLVPAVASAVVGFASIHLWKSESFVLTSALASIWRVGTPRQVRDRIIDDRLEELDRARADLQRKSKLYNWAAALLLLTLTTEVGVFLYSLCWMTSG